MPAKRTGARTRATPAGEASTPIDLGATARQIGLFESANGLPSGIYAIIAAVAFALVLVPIRAAWRALADRGRR